MYIKLNDKGFVSEYSLYGRLDGGIEIKDNINFDENEYFSYYYDKETKTIKKNNEKVLEMQEIDEIRKKVSEAKKYLENTDYIIIQIMEGVCHKSSEEIANIKLDRENARKIIRESDIA